MIELYRKHRPTKFKQMLGQDEAVQILMKLVAKRKVPHATVFTGESGCGKTTLARILCGKLKAQIPHDVFEENAAIDGGIDLIRKIRTHLHRSPFGSCRVWIIDECHQLTRPAQESFLKMLEDTPDWVYFMLCTTDPGKLLKTIKTRCTEIHVKPLTSSCMEQLIDQTCAKEKTDVSEKVRDKIVEVASGSARKALVILHSILNIEKEKDQLNAIREQDSEKQAIDLCRALMNPGVDWKMVSGILKNITEEPETVRRIVLGYANAVALNSGMGKAFTIIDCFSNNYYDCGKAGLTWSCKQALISMGVKR